MSALIIGAKKAPGNIFRALFGAAKVDVQAVRDVMQMDRPLIAKAAVAPASKDVETDERFEIADGVLVSEVDGRHLTLRLYSGRNTRIERIVRMPTERKPFMKASMAFIRHHIDPYTPIKARNAGLPFSLEGALAFTKSLGLKSIKVHEMATEKGANDLVSKLQADEEMFKESCKAAAKQEPKAHQEASESVPQGEILSEATGYVVSAGDKRIEQPNRRAYFAFEIQVRDARGEIHEFMGKDLKEQFQQRIFKVGDLIHLVKRRSSFEISDEGKGGAKSRTKNFYTIRVLERGSV